MRLASMRPVWAFAVVAVLVTVAHAEVLQIEGKLSAFDAAERTLTINDKTYEIAKKCSVSINGKPATLEDIPKDEAVVVTYDDKFEMVSAIAVGQPTWLFYDLGCKGKQPAEDFEVITADEIAFHPNPPNGRGILVSSQKYGKCKLRFEFMYDNGDMPGNPFVAVASRKPNLEGKEFLDRWPFGIEFKLWHGGFGRLVLPHPEFKADMAYGQERKGRDVPPLKQQVPLRNGWNIVEIAVQGDNAVVAKGNGVTLNAISNAQNVDGHLVVFAPQCAFRIRNMIIEVDGESTPLSFSSIGTVACTPLAK
jgi:hypothetical protein